MARLLIVALALLVGSVTCQPSRIVGGWPIPLEEAPYMCQVDYRNIWSNSWGQSCGASIISSLYLLSAAHCFQAQVSNRRGRCGAQYRNTGGIVTEFAYYKNHPSYGQLGADGDITVVRLANRLEYSPVVQPIAIIPQGTELPDGTLLGVFGWGTTSSGGLSSNELLATEIETVNRQSCAQIYQSTSRVTDNMICGGVTGGGRDACQGDSGGPLLIDGIQVAIVSWGRGCAHRDFPGVNTRVASYTDWIVQNTVY